MITPADHLALGMEGFEGVRRTYEIHWKLLERICHTADSQNVRTLLPFSKSELLCHTPGGFRGVVSGFRGDES